MSGRKVSVVLRTAAGDEAREFAPDLRLIDVCRLLRVPPNTVSPFATGSAKIRRVIGLYEPLDRLVRSGDEQLILQFDRNLNYHSLLSDARSSSVEHVPAVMPVTEYTFSSGTYGYITHATLDVQACRNFVNESVADFVEAYREVLGGSATIVVGTSGGGDSNALLAALVEATRNLTVSIRPVMLLGAPEWDAAIDRAKELCASLGLSLQFVGSERVNRLLGRLGNSSHWLSDFHAHFPREDSDVIGTLAIRLALSDVARKLGASCVVTGLNLEDLLAECFLRLTQGELPLEFPVRIIDGINFCYPVYRVPKKLLDGCHPEYALANYRERSASVMMGRAIPYYLAQSMNSAVPGIEFDLLEGFRSLPHVRPATLPEFGFAILPGVEICPELRSRWENYIKGDRPVST
ncbi:MAG: hypothetical protein ACRDSR_09395 [Pseudonocardiaceae bacterium]